MNGRRRALLGLVAAGGGGLWAGLVRAGLPSGGVPVGRTLEVGPGREFRRIGDVARAARPGDTVEVDAGDYRADVAVWNQDWLTLRARGGPVRLIAQDAHAEGKGIWVVRARKMRVEGFEFIGAKVADRNGAGIRFDSGSLHASDCAFRECENGILTGNHPETVLVLERCEFDRNGAGDGQSHMLYAGAIARLEVTGCHFHHGRVGHLLKSRARESRILYNRLSDEDGGRASYELDLPNGGDVLVLGNLIQQSATGENFTLVSYGAEGYRWPRNALAMAHNTLVNERSAGGRFLAVRPGEVAVTLLNNVFAGVGSVDAGALAEQAGNVTLARRALAEAQPYEYRIAPAVRSRWAAVRPEDLGRGDLRPDREYLHPRRLRALEAGLALRPGAIQTGY